MEWRIVKTGADMFDALHAYGLGLLVAYASHRPVKLVEQGTFYQLDSRTTRLNASTDILGSVLELPTLPAIRACEQEGAEVPLSVATFDGLLAALFTTPSVRLVSVTDLLTRQRFAQRPTAARDSLKKVRSAVARWMHFVQRESCGSLNWLLDILQDYAVGRGANGETASPRIPLPVKRAKTDLGLVMAMDPSNSYSARRPISDGLVTERVNLTLDGTRYAPLLAFIGAARFLRAQRVAGHLVNFYVPLAASVVLCTETTLPILFPVEHASEQATALLWLTYFEKARRPGADWHGLAYQVMQTQGARQSISRDRGCLDNGWLAAIESRAGSAVLGYWESLLNQSQEQAPFELDHLASCLTRHRASDWLFHLRDAAVFQHCHPQSQFRPYSLKEVKEVTKHMVAPTHLPLRTILERESGTLRFGRALRLLGQHNPAPLRDLIDALDVAQTGDQLVRILAQAAQECTLVSAQSQFIIVPSDEDLKYLLDDVEAYGARTIAGLLIILSALRYPRSPDTSPPPRSAEPAPATSRRKRSA